MNPLQIIISFFLTTVALYILSKLPTGVEIDSVGKALISAAVLGILNALLYPIWNYFISRPIIVPLYNILSLISPRNAVLIFGLSPLVFNVFIFSSAALLVTGFRLRWGIWSALIGSFTLTGINLIIN